MAAFIIPSFAKGELDPALYGRVDLAAYQVGLRTARNLIIHTGGGASNRPGTLFIGPVKTHTIAPRLFNFRFRTTDQYVLEFGNLYMRVIRNDAHVTNATVSITAATQAQPVVVTAGSHGFSNGEEVFITGVVGMTQLNGNRYIVANKTANTLELTNQVTGANIDGRQFGVWTSGGTVATIFELTTPYVTADLANLKAVQSGDIMTLTHATYAPRDLARTDHNVWTLTVNTYAPGQADPVGVAVAKQGTGASTTHRYRVTAIRREEDVFEESLPGLSTTTTSSASALAQNPVVVTAGSHPYVNGDEIEMSGYTQMTEVNGRRFIVRNKQTNTFELEGEDGSGYTAETSGGSVNATFVELTNAESVANTTLAEFNRITWTAVSGISGGGRYAIYRRESGRYGLIAEVDGEITSFDDVTTAVDEAGVIHVVDSSITPPRARNPFLASGTFPGASSYYQQRQVYGGSLNTPDTSYYSQTGNRLNLSVSTPTQADDALTFVLTSADVQEIRHFVPLGDLLIFTDSSEWRVNAGDNSGFSAATLQQNPIGTNIGSSHIRPIIAGGSVLFLEDGNTRINDLSFATAQSTARSATDLLLLAGHLLAEEGVASFVVSDWSYSRVPESRLYVARSDGQLLTMTFDKAQEVIAWTHWDTEGKFERTISLKRSVSGVEDGIYFVIQRTIDGNTVRYIERLSTRKFSDVRDAFFVDSGLSLDSPTTITNVTAANPIVVTAAAHGYSNGDLVDLEGIIWTPIFDEVDNETQPDQLNDRRFVIAGVATNTFQLLDEEAANIGGATQANPVVVTATAHGFSDGDTVHISDVLGMTSINDNSFTVANADTDTFELLGENGLSYNAWTAGGLARLQLDGTDNVAYVSDGKSRKAVTILTGLEHLEGESVQILADGNPLPPVSIAEATDARPTTVVVDARLVLGTAASRVHIGLKYIADLETLNVEASSGTIQGKRTKISKVISRFKKSRLPLVGPDADNLVPMKQRDTEPLGAPIALLTGDNVTTIAPDWNSNGRVFYRQNQPLPTTWLAVIPDILTGDG